MKKCLQFKAPMASMVFCSGIVEVLCVATLVRALRNHVLLIEHPKEQRAEMDRLQSERLCRLLILET
jgi:hypothetical protein